MTSRLILAALFSVTIMRSAAAQSSSAPVDDPETLCTIRDPRVNEASGIVPGIRNADVFYVVNDSGGTPDVFAIGRDGAVRGSFRLRAAKNVDWEDLAWAPPPKADQPHELCVADIGDNREERRSVTIYRFPEPALSESESRTEVAPRAIRVRYADGPHNAEALVVDPRTGDGYIFTKRDDGRSDAYRLAAGWGAADAPADKEVIATRVGELKLPRELPMRTIVTAADVSAAGDRLAMRSYATGWEWRATAGGPGVFELMLNAPPSELTLAVEPQGEALCYDRMGRRIHTISEHTPTAIYSGKVP